MNVPRKGWLVIGTLTLLTAIGYFLQNPQSSESEPQLSLPALPDLQSLDAPVRQQFRERYDFLLYLLQDAKTDPQGLAWGFGQLGRVYHAYQYLEAARLCYRNAQSLEPDGFLWAYYLGQVERILGHYQASSRFLLQAFERRPDYLPSLIWLAENELVQYQIDPAEARYMQVLQSAPTHVMARYGLAQVALARKQFQQAVNYLEPALAEQPRAFQLHYQLGLAYQGLGAQEQAQWAFQQVPNDDLMRISIEFDDPLMQQISDLRRSAQTDPRRGRTATAQGHFRVAVQVLERAIESNPERIDTRYNLAVALLRLGRREQALGQLEGILERTPNHVITHLLLGRLLANERRFVEAEQHLRAALASDPDSGSSHLALANVLSATNRLEEALKNYRRVLELDPAQISVSSKIAITLLRLEQFQAALEYLEQSLDKFAEPPELKLLLARLLAAAPEPRLRDGQRALALAESIGQGKTVVAAETLAMVFAELSQFDRAIHWQQLALSQIESVDGDSQRVLERLALYQRGKPCRQPWVSGEDMNQRSAGSVQK